MEIFWTVASFLLTLMILSFVFGDNPFFRVASYLFVGVSAGYTAVLLIYNVIWPRLVMPIMSGDLLAAIPLGLGLLLAFRLAPGLSRAGNISMAYLAGAAAAVAVGGAVFGTLLGQTRGAINAFDVSGVATGGEYHLVEAIILLVGTVSTLVYFQFSARSRQGQPPRRPAALEALAQFGQVFIAITLGSLFAGVVAAALVALIERLGFLQQTIFSYLFK
jgi:hypothetical protein